MIGVFDSGLGGLTALRELRRLRPDLDIVFYADTARIPYGTRSKSTLLSWAKEGFQFLKNQGAEQILVACGTLSTTVLPTLQKDFPLTLWGVVEPAAHLAFQTSRKKCVGILGTTATIASHAFENALQQQGAVSLWSRACPLFVSLVENGLTSPTHPIVKEVVHHYLSDAKTAGIDTLILGCTHFPLLAHAIHTYLPGVTLIGAGEAAAHALCNTHPRVGHGNLSMYVSDNPKDFRARAEAFLGGTIPCPILLKEEK